MIAYKGFRPGLICRNYQFIMGLNVTDKANCAQNGFHCAEDPLDCLTYYSDIKNSEYYIVRAGGDLDEDGIDSKISCTELTILKRLIPGELLMYGLVFMADHPTRPWNCHVKKERAEAQWGYALARGVNPVAKGRHGDFLALAKEDPATGRIDQIVVMTVDGTNVRADTWYGVEHKRER